MADELLEGTELDAAMRLTSASARSNPRLQAEIDILEQATKPEPAPVVEAPVELNPLPKPTIDYTTRGGIAFDEEYYTEQTELKRESDEWGFAGAVSRSFMHGDNIAVNVGKEVYRKVTMPANPAWNNGSVTEWLDKHKEIPPTQRWRYFGTNSAAEADALWADATADIRAQKVNQMRGGFDAFAASAIAGLIDVDAPLMLFSGGVSAGAKIGINATKAGRILVGTTAGSMLGVSMGTLDYAVNPNSTPESIALMAVMGAGFGTVGGVFAKAPDLQANAAMQRDAVEELGEQVVSGPLPPRTAPEATPSWGSTPAMAEVADASPEAAASAIPRQPRTFSTDEVNTAERDLLTGGGSSSVGAQQTGTIRYDGMGINQGVRDPETKQMILDAYQWKRQSPEMAEWDDPTAWMNSGYPEAAVRKAIRLRETLMKAGITSDFDRLMKSNLATAQKFAVMMLESPSGIARSQTNAAVIKEAYHTELRRAYEPVEQHFKEWHYQENGYKLNQHLIDQPGTGIWTSRERFDQEVIRELMFMRNGTGQGASSKAAKDAAKAVDAFWKKEYEIGRGQGNDMPLEGYDQFNWETGYVPQSWSGRKMAQMIESAGKTRKARDAMRQRIVNFIDSHYAQQAPNWDPKYRKIAATAVVDRALSSRRGFQRDLIALLSGDESEFIRAAMFRNGIPPGEIDKVIDAIMGSRKQKQQLGQTRSRQEVDFRASDANTGINMMDMLETDLTLLMGRRAHRTSGLAALARMGIPNRIEFEKVKKAILSEQEARGNRILRQNRDNMDKVDDFIDGDEKLDGDYLDAVYGYFSGIRPGAGKDGDATVQRIKKVTQLSLMNQLGLTSLGEHGAIAGTVGWRRWWSHMSQDLQAQFGKPDSPLMQEMKTFSVFSPEESMFSGRLLQELDRSEASDLGAKFDAVLNKGQELQGWWSGFYKVRANQQRVAISATTAKLYEGFKKGADGFNDQRLKDMGLDKPFLQRTLSHAQFNAKGELEKLNMDQWDFEDVRQFQRVMARVSNQLVQKAMAGESNWAFQSNGLAQMFFQLKSFPLLAVNKQFVRNARMADKEAMQTFVFGLVFGGAAYAARQAINAQPENLTPEKIARGAINYANMTGWLSMVVDPVLESVGADASISGYSSRGAGSIVSLPASFGVVDRLAHLPGALKDVAFQHTGLTEVSNSDLRVLQSIPLLGNAYGINGLLNAAKD